jgi:cyclophilin family peptidyl-prolyl cis-trans isomerase
MSTGTSNSTPTTSRQNPKHLTSPVSEFSEKGTLALFHTSLGDFVIQMRDDKPITAGNFVNLAKQGFYDGTVFHRVILGFMIQGGQNLEFDVESIPDEVGKDNRNTPGTIAMAKTNQPNSATSQFFINVADNGNNPLDRAGTKFDSVYAVFGQVVDGMDVVLKISRVPVTRNVYGENSQPASPVTLLKVTIMN